MRRLLVAAIATGVFAFARWFVRSANGALILSRKLRKPCRSDHHQQGFQLTPWNGEHALHIPQHPRSKPLLNSAVQWRGACAWGKEHGPCGWPRPGVRRRSRQLWAAVDFSV